MSFYFERFVSLEDNTEMISCAGAILCYIQQNRVDGGLQESEFDISCVRAYSLNNIMKINSDTLFSLQIFEGKSHPNMHLTTSGKDGLSLWGLFSTETVTPLGKILMRKWFLRPILELQELKARHDAVEKLLQVSNGGTVDQLKKSLRSIKNIKTVLSRIKRNVTIRDWALLIKFCFNALKIRTLILDLYKSLDVPLFQDLIKGIDVECLQNIGNSINRIVDFEGSLSS
jgi:DNA mismatch repair protein MSH5